VRDFQKVIPFVSLDRQTVLKLGPAAARMARAEGLEAHARAIESRLPQD
jgi:histidinol dehydrogenase